ncbi:MAG TPA: hypothetical protein VNJ04_03555 [Gemmatimonadaceae bacterium]|nr:hypothetical protein [Gemmatimonadaceae bacterium]
MTHDIEDVFTSLDDLLATAQKAPALARRTVAQLRGILMRALAWGARGRPGRTEMQIIEQSVSAGGA